MPKRRRRALLRRVLPAALLLLAGLAGAAALAAWLLIDPEVIKPRLEAAAARATGGTLTLAGPLRLGFGPSPVLRARDVRFTAPNGSRVQLGALTARVALLPLARGEIDIERIAIDEPVITLAAAPEAAPKPAPTPTQAATPPAASRPSRLRFALRALAVRDGRITWRGTTIAVPRLDAVAAAPNAPLALSGTLGVNGQSFALSGETGPLGEVFARPPGAPPFPVQLALQGAGARLAAHGGIADPLHGRGYALKAEGALTSLAPLAPFLPAPPPPLHDAAFAADLADAGGAPRLGAVTLHLAGLDLGAFVPGLAIGRADLAAPDPAKPAQATIAATLRGTPLHVAATIGPWGPALPVALTAEAPPAVTQLSAKLTLARAPRPSVKGDIAAAAIDLDRLLPLLAPPQAQPAAAPPPAPPSAGPRPLIPDRPIPLGGLRAFDADLALRFAAVASGGIAYRDVAGHLALQNGYLALDPLSGRSPGGALAARLLLDARTARPQVAATLRAPAIALAPVAAALGWGGAISGAAALDAELNALGDSPRALAATLGGHLAFEARDADIDHALLAAALGGVLREARMPPDVLGAAGRTKLRCLSVRLLARDGVVTVTHLLLDSPRLVLRGSGTAALATETLALHLRPVLRVGPGVEVPVRLTGSFRDPKPALDGGEAGEQALLGALIGALGKQRRAPAAAADGCAPQPAAGR